jgi:hypothetical protein
MHISEEMSRQERREGEIYNESESVVHIESMNSPIHVNYLTHPKRSDTPLTGMGKHSHANRSYNYTISFS